MLPGLPVHPAVPTGTGGTRPAVLAAPDGERPAVLAAPDGERPAVRFVQMHVRSPGTKCTVSDGTRTGPV
jgi:hypothetical protein